VDFERLGMPATAIKGRLVVTDRFFRSVTGAMTGRSKAALWLCKKCKVRVLLKEA